MPQLQTKMFFSIMLFVMLFFVLTNAVRNDLKKRQLLDQGQPCKNEYDDLHCTTLICHIKGEDIHKCQLTDERDVGITCVVSEACKTGLVCFVPASSSPTSTVSNGTCQPTPTNAPKQ
ncbi:hypothetical protein F8M41_006742 [Gigaspora margarita]|uniref:Uncharacterized protein n=1 Tax=Gigaspora margarita TaxID=4874 RepID=A0A8H4ER88_GIGMA|nr:hypothetical protein F8M41_006742 [Gigaspora margarita]